MPSHQHRALHDLHPPTNAWGEHYRFRQLAMHKFANAQKLTAAAVPGTRS